jgi:hypothetical protein
MVTDLHDVKGSSRPKGGSLACAAARFGNQGIPTSQGAQLDPIEATHQAQY